MRSYFYIVTVPVQAVRSEQPRRIDPPAIIPCSGCDGSGRSLLVEDTRCPECDGRGTKVRAFDFAI